MDTDAPPAPGSSPSRAAAPVALAGGPLACAVCLAVVPAPEDAPLAPAMAGLVAWVAIWWLSEVVPLAATALIPLVYLPVAGISPAREVARAYGHDLILLFLAGFLLAAALSRTRLDRRLALAILARAGNRPARLVAGVMLVTGLLSAVVSNSATAAMMMPVGLALCSDRRGARSLAASEDDAFAAALLLGIAWAASIGGVATLIGTPPNAVLAAVLLEATGRSVGFVEWLAVGLPVAAVLGVAGWAWLVRGAFRLDRVGAEGSSEWIARERAALGPVEPSALTTAIVVAATACAWITRPWWAEPLFGPARVSDATVGIAGAVALFAASSLPRLRRPTPPLDATALAELPWGVLVLFGGGLALAHGLSRSRLDQVVATALAGAGDVPPFVLVALVVVAIVFLTEVASNTGVASMALPLIVTTATALGESPFAIAAPAAIAASMAFMLPAATPPNAIVFGTGRIGIRAMARAGIMMNLIAAAVVSVVGFALASAVAGGG